MPPLWYIFKHRHYASLLSINGEKRHFHANSKRVPLFGNEFRKKVFETLIGCTLTVVGGKKNVAFVFYAGVKNNLQVRLLYDSLKCAFACASSFGTGLLDRMCICHQPCLRASYSALLILASSCVSEDVLEQEAGCTDGHIVPIFTITRNDTNKEEKMITLSFGCSVSSQPNPSPLACSSN